MIVVCQNFEQRLDSAWSRLQFVLHLDNPGISAVDLDQLLVEQIEELARIKAGFKVRYLIVKRMYARVEERRNAGEHKPKLDAKEAEAFVRQEYPELFRE